jgi:hypothetical protein
MNLLSRNDELSKGIKVIGEQIMSIVESKLVTAIASEKSLAKLWDTPEEDEAWAEL